jgi:hypothetical protein
MAQTLASFVFHVLIYFTSTASGAVPTRTIKASQLDLPYGMAGLMAITSLATNSLCFP